MAKYHGPQGTVLGVDAVIFDLDGVLIDSEQVWDEVRQAFAARTPSPDVYLAAAAQLGVSPASCYAVEDSTNGLKAALAAGMTVLAVPNPHFPPAADVLAQVRVLSSIADLPDALA